MSKEWSREQWQAWHRTVDWSHRTHVFARTDKMLRDAGIDSRKLTCGQQFSLQDSISEAIRRGAIRLLNELNGIEETGPED